MSIKEYWNSDQDMDDIISGPGVPFHVRLTFSLLQASFLVLAVVLLFAGLLAGGFALYWLLAHPLFLLIVGVVVYLVGMPAYYTYKDRRD